MFWPGLSEKRAARLDYIINTGKLVTCGLSIRSGNNIVQVNHGPCASEMIFFCQAALPSMMVQAPSLQGSSSTPGTGLVAVCIQEKRVWHLFLWGCGLFGVLGCDDVIWREKLL